MVVEIVMEEKKDEEKEDGSKCHLLIYYVQLTYLNLSLLILKCSLHKQMTRQ